MADGEEPGGTPTGEGGSSGATLGDILKGLFWISFKVTFMGCIYGLYNLFTTAIGGWLAPLLSSATQFPHLEVTYGAAIKWFNIANEWVPITEAIATWSLLLLFAALWAPIKAAVKYFVPTLG